MLETANWLKKYFNQSPDAIFIFKDDTLVLSNSNAHQLEQNFSLAPGYLLQVAKNAWQQRTNDDCANCTIKKMMDHAAVPLATQGDHGKPVYFSIVYKPLDIDQNVFSLTIENREQEKRLSNLEGQRLLNRYINEAHEKERQRISQDLHDSIAQGVYSAIIGVRRISSENLSGADLRQLSQTIEMQLQETLSEIKGMALDIRPSVLDSFGLVPAIKALAKRLQENSGVTINVLAHAHTDDLTTDIQSVLYRICQEAINNSLKHAKATEINILITSHPHFIQLEVLDDGNGFDVQKEQGFNGHSLGLMNMNERVAALNGSFNIDSHVGEGTTVTVKFPCNKYLKESVKKDV